MNHGLPKINWEQFYLILLLFMLILSSCAAGQSDERMSPESTTEGNAARGEQLILNYGCGACHTIEGIAGANTQVGPPLNNFAERRIIAGVLVNTPENLARWIQNPQAVQANTTMPNLGVTAEDARDIVAYLYGLN